MPVYHFDGSESRKHDDIDTVHVDKDCHHLSDADIYDVLHRPENASVCGTCGDGDETEEIESDDD